MHKLRMQQVQPKMMVLKPKISILTYLNHERIVSSLKPY